MRSICLAAAWLLCAMPAWAADPSIAVFDMEFVNTSPAPDTPEELARLGVLSAQLRELLAKPGRYEVVDTTPVRDKVAHGPSLRTCNTCAVDAARTLGADLAAHGWVQKVSNLILNVNLSVEDVADGRDLLADMKKGDYCYGRFPIGDGEEKGGFTFQVRHRVEERRLPRGSGRRDICGAWC